MRTFHTLALAAALTAASPGAQAQALSNGDFSAGLAGWQVLGDASVQNDAGGNELWLTNASLDFEDDFPLPAGALNRSGQGAATSGLESFIGIAGGALDPDPANGLQAYEGTAVLQSFSAAAGDTLSFNWDFGTSDNFADYAFAVVDGQLFRLGGSGEATLPGRLGNQLQTGAQSFSFSFASGGMHSVAFGVVDVGDYNVTSTLAVSGVQVVPVPEPSALLLMLAGIGVVAGSARRRISLSSQT